MSDGYKLLIDDSDFGIVKPYQWYARLAPKTYYVVRYIKSQKSYQLIHHFLTGAQYVDHINGLGWDNRRENLRSVTHQQNTWNANHSYGLSKYKGVHWAEHAGKWRARIEVSGKKVHVGYYKSEVEAALAYNVKATELFGEFAYLNQI